MTLVAGRRTTAASLQAEIGYGMLGMGSRSSNSSFFTATTPGIGVLRVDGLTLRANRQFEVWTSPLRGTGAAGTGIEATLRLATGASPTATTASTAIATTTVAISDAGIYEDLALYALVRTITSDTVGSIILCAARVGSTGSSHLGGATTYPIEIYVRDAGPITADTGVDL